MLKSWTGNCAYFDANGNYLGMLPVSVPDDPDDWITGDWITGDTIYVKCLKANHTQMASAMTDMAVLAGASAEGAIPPAAFTAVSAQVQAQVEFAPNPTVVREDGMIWGFTEQQHDQDLLDAAGFDSTVHDIDRWVQTAACPGEIFKLTIIDPSADKMFELREGWKWERDGDHIEVQGLQPVDSVEHHDFSLFDICYVETKNQYVAWDPPIGILRIYVNGGTTVLKTIIVDYGIVARYALSAIVHEQANVTPNMIQGWLDEATNNTFLKDSLPWGGSIKQRYDDDEDVHCPIALVLENPDEPLATFNGTDVHRDGHAQEYNVLSPNDPQKIQNLLTTPWFNNVAYGFDLIVVTNLGGSVGNGTRDGWDNGDALWDENDGHIWVQTDNNLNNPDHAVAHEWGHYKGDLPDLYFCSNCGQNPCTCGLKRWRDPPNHPDNLMTMGVDVGVLAGDKTALTR